MLILVAAINFDVRRTAVIRNLLLLQPCDLPSQKSENHGLTPLLPHPALTPHPPPLLGVDIVIKVGVVGFSQRAAEVEDNSGHDPQMSFSYLVNFDPTPL